MKTRIIVIAAIAAALLVGATAANAAAVSWHQAIRVTKRAASKRAARQGITLPASWWTVACYEGRSGHWRCDAGAMRGYCNARLWISGTERRPVVRRVGMACFDEHNAAREIGLSNGKRTFDEHARGCVVTATRCFKSRGLMTDLGLRGGLA